MTSVRFEVLWSPVHRNKFITWGTEIHLYEAVPGKIKDQKVDFSSTSTSARLLSVLSSQHFIKCVDIFPREKSDVLLAIGQNSGKVTLSAFSPSNFDSLGINGLELVPNHSRQCNAVVWNKSETQLLAAGLERYRSDHCVLVWDIMSRPANTVAELGLSDTAHSLAWLADHPRTLVAGMNNKQLRMVDLRDASKVASSSHTKAVFGVTVPPYSSHLLASYFENQVALWDLRSFEKPITSMQLAKAVSKVHWCPTRNNLLGSLQRDSRSINLHYLHAEEAEPSFLERRVRSATPGHVTSFSWHPFDENRLLTISITGSLNDCYISERIAHDWSRNSQLVWTHGQKTLVFASSDDPVYKHFGDLSPLMRRRAAEGYGLKPELKDNARFIEGDEHPEAEHLRNLWLWLDHSSSLSDSRAMSPSNDQSTGNPGIRSVLGMDSTNPPSLSVKSELTFLPWCGLNASVMAKLYRSDIRDRALNLCNWNFVHDSKQLKMTVERLDSEGLTVKAAALAVFSLQLKLAIHLLANTQYSTLAMALSGYTDDKNSVWRESCIQSREKLEDPYMRAMFAFLTNDSDSYEHVINEDMDVKDRIGFALTFLSDSKLVDFLSDLTEKLISQGNLSAFILAGASSQAIRLLQQYLDFTADLQSVSFIVMRSFPPELLEHEQVKYWISCYRDLLDSWSMWNERAKFDIELNLRCSVKPQQQVYIICNFCGKSLTVEGNLNRKGLFQRTKVSCCPHCRKPQPRCAICLKHMGTPSSYSQTEVSTPTSTQSNPSLGVKINAFDNWYTWCQTCRHGGHAGHITHWFKLHQECPVTGCSCRCLSLDAASSDIPI